MGVALPMRCGSVVVLIRWNDRFNLSLDPDTARSSTTRLWPQRRPRPAHFCLHVRARVLLNADHPRRPPLGPRAGLDEESVLAAGLMAFRHQPEWCSCAVRPGSSSPFDETTTVGSPLRTQSLSRCRVLDIVELVHEVLIGGTIAGSAAHG